MTPTFRLSRFHGRLSGCAAPRLLTRRLGGTEWCERCGNQLHLGINSADSCIGDLFFFISTALANLNPAGSCFICKIYLTIYITSGVINQTVFMNSPLQPNQGSRGVFGAEPSSRWVWGRKPSFPLTPWLQLNPNLNPVPSLGLDPQTGFGGCEDQTSCRHFASRIRI